MALSVGSGPLAPNPGGAFNFDLAGTSPAHRIYFAPEQRRLRALVGDSVVLDTTRARLLYESAIAPRIYAPLEDYAMEHFTPTQTSTHCPFKGDASYWTLRVGARELPDVLWSYPQPIAAAPFLAGYASLYQDRVDAWLVEDDRVAGHLTDPFHRVDVHDSSRAVVVRVGGVEVARSPRPKLLFETSLPLRVYIAAADVRAGVLVAGSGKRTVCPYKGQASYWTVAGVQDAAWSYEFPLAEAARVQGHLSFDTGVEGVEVELADR